MRTSHVLRSTPNVQCQRIRMYARLLQCWTLAAFLAAPALGSAAESANYTLTPVTLDVAGLRATSADYTLDSSTTPGRPAGAANYAARAGFAGSLYDAAAFSLTASSLTLKETSTLQLAPMLTLDDATFLVVPPALIVWSVLDGPLTGIAADGAVTAGTVFQDTAAIAQGTYNGTPATLALTVLNVGDDDFGIYAADGITDAWQVQHFGIDNPFAAPGVDADGDGQSNLTEFLAGFIPTDASSLLTTRALSLSGPAFTMELSRVQPGTRYVFERMTDFSAWTDVFTLDPAAIATPFVQPLPALGTRSIFRVRLEAGP